MVLAVAVVAIILAADTNNSVMKLVNYAWGGFGAAFGPIVLLSVLWKRITAKGALWYVDRCGYGSCVEKSRHAVI